MEKVRAKLKKFKAFIIAFLLTVASIVGLVVLFPPTPPTSKAAWLTDWGYRKSHLVNSATGAGTLYQIKITCYYGTGTDSASNVYLNNYSRTDFGDVRFTDNDGVTLLDYWMESKVDSNNAVFWVEVKDSLESETQMIHVYYGKADATTTSSGTNTFICFDDFGDPLLSLWTEMSGAWDTADVSGNWVVNLTNGVTANYMYFTSSAVSNAAVDVKITTPSSADNAYAIGSCSRWNGSYLDLTVVIYNWHLLGNNWTLKSVSTIFGTPYTSNSPEATTSVLSTRFYNSSSSQTTYLCYYNDMLDYNYSGANIPVYTKVGLHTYGVIQNRYADDFRVRKFIYPEPVHSTWGTEETPLTPPTGIFSTIRLTSVHTCPLDNRTFVIAYHDDDNDDVSFQIYDTNGTQVLAEVDVDDASGGMFEYTSIGVSALSSTTFVIGWADRGEQDATFAVYNIAGTLLYGPTDADTTAGSSMSVQVSCFNSTFFVIGWYDRTALTAQFAIYEASNATVKVGPIDAATTLSTSYSVSVSTFNSTTFVVGWFDNTAKDATFAIYNSAGVNLTLPVDADDDVGTCRSVSVSTLNSTHFVMGWFDATDQDATFAIYDSIGTLKTGPTDADTAVGTQSLAVQVAALNSTAFVISWYDYVDFDLTFATYLSDNTTIASATDIESWPTAANAPFMYQSPCSQETANNIGIYEDNWIIAYSNTTTQAICKTFYPNGTVWNGYVPYPDLSSPTYSDVGLTSTVAGQLGTTFYLRGTLPTHGQPNGTLVDTGILDTTPPTTAEFRWCTQRIMFYYDIEPAIETWNIIEIYWHIYWRSDTNAQLGYQCNGTFVPSYDNERSLGSSSSIKLYEGYWNVTIAPPNINDKYFFVLGIDTTDGAPEIDTNATHMSYVTFNCGNVSTLYTKWTDNIAMSSYIFGCNNTGPFKNDSLTAWSPTGSPLWSNITRALNNTVGVRIEWQIWAMDTYGNWNSTGLQSFVTTAATPLVIGWNNFLALNIDVDKTLGQVNASLNLDSINWSVVTIDYGNGTQWSLVYGTSYNSEKLIASTSNTLYIYCNVAGTWGHGYP